MNEQNIQLSLFVVFYVKFVAFLPLITIKSSLKLLDSDRLETRTKLSLSLFSVTLLKMAELPPIIRNSERIPTFSSLLECVEYFSDIHFKRAFVIALGYTAH